MRLVDEPTPDATPSAPHPPSSSRLHTFLFVFVGLLILGFIGGTFFVLRSLLPRLTARTLAISNMRLLSRATAIYAFDNDELTPPGSCWMDALTPYTPIDTHPFHAPNVYLDGHKMDRYGIAMNQLDSSVPYLGDHKPSQSPLYFESKSLDRNATGTFPDAAIARYEGPNQLIIPIAGFDQKYGMFLTKLNRYRWIRHHRFHL